ncbi:MAG: 2-hydroxyacyl-CoA dehydratase family protein [Chloroflexi bacterium]|nr:2-hydroxyacyl-CoA dehydratase family protein [Chloroflexota bacterium]
MAYPTAEWKIWERAKKARSNQLKDGPETVKQRGGVLALGSVGHDHLLKMFDDLNYAYIPGEPYGAQVAMYPEFSTACCEAVEKNGFAGDLCGYVRHYMGSVILRKTPWGTFPTPDFCIEGAHCDSHNKWFQAISEQFKCPYFVYDEPEMFNWYTMPQHAVAYRYNNYMEEILWLEKKLNKKMNDEKLCKYVLKHWNGRVERNRMMEKIFNHKPTIIDIKTLYSLLGPGIDRGPDFQQMLMDEVDERIAKGIAAIPNQKMTMMHDNIPPWYALHIFRYMEKWGVVCIPSHYMNQGWMYDPDAKKLVTGKTYKEEGKREPKTREEAVWDMAGWPGDGSMTGDGPKDILVAMAKQFPIDGAIFHLNKGCEGWSRGRLLAKVALERELGLPTCTYEGSGSDRRDWNEAQTLTRLDAFFESMGLRKEN